MRIAFLTQRLPYAPNRGDRTRAYHEIMALSAAGHEVHLFSLAHDRDEEAHAGDLAGKVATVRTIRVTRARNLARGVAALPTARPLTHVLLDGRGWCGALQRLKDQHHPELVFAFCSSMARFTLKGPLAGLPYVIDLVDVDSAKWAALAESATPWRRWIYRRESRVLARFEAEAVRHSRVTWVVNDREASLLREIVGPASRVRVLENGADIDWLRPPSSPADSADVVFCGVMNYEPNEDAAIWLAGEVWPRVEAGHPGARLLIVGADPTHRVRDSERPGGTVVVTGTVDDVRPYLWSSAVAVAPLRIARGVQSKVLEAAAAGLPVVVTPAVVGGLPEEVMPACRVAASAEAFADAMLALLHETPEWRRELAAQAHLERLAWSTRLKPMLQAIDEISRRERPATW